MPDVDLYFEAEGKRQTLAEYVDGPEDRMRARVAEQVVEQVGGIECPQHGETPTVIAQEVEDEELVFRFEACCEEIVQQAEKRLNA